MLSMCMYVLLPSLSLLKFWSDKAVIDSTENGFFNQISTQLTWCRTTWWIQSFKVQIPSQTFQFQDLTQTLSLRYKGSLTLKNQHFFLNTKPVTSKLYDIYSNLRVTIKQSIDCFIVPSFFFFTEDCYHVLLDF